MSLCPYSNCQSKRFELINNKKWLLKCLECEKEFYLEMYDELESFTYNLANELSEVKEAFVLEELKPYFNIIEKDNEYSIEWRDNVKLRLSEYEDFKFKIISLIDKKINEYKNKKDIPEEVSKIYIEAFRIIRKEITCQ
jgi:hypothetical protein